MGPEDILMPAKAPVKLRPGRRSDLDALLGFERRFFESDHQMSRRSLRHFIASSKSVLIVAEIGGKVAGCALVNYRRNSRFGRLYTLAVDSRFRRRGLARRLLARAETNSIRRGCKGIRLEVREDDAGTIALYETSGYRLIGRRRHYYDGRIDALRFEKILGLERRRRGVFRRPA
jgi:ribosomal protein S18 acetylase RimI-like enzyme